MSLDILNRQRKVRFDTHAIRPRLEAALTAAGVADRETTLLLLSDAAIRRLNREWREVDRPTDCLSFPADEGEGAGFAGDYLGDIVISLERAREQGPIHLARDLPPDADPLVEEVVFLFVHSLLHLLGHDHHRPADARRMRAEEARILASPGVSL
jgi:probable rRNA maturation factor